MSEKVAEIISWNFWQMDGRENIVPYSNIQKKVEPIPLFGYEATTKNFDEIKKPEQKENLRKSCKVMDWETNKERAFENIGGKDK